mgnify:FL=1|tara:strand:+ start:1101 stop:1388 length:288 start_codon:yes stop_codon:yes gene_type:complete
MTTQTDLSSSLSGALDTLLQSLRAAAPAITCSLAGEGSEWYYEINKKAMIKVPNGTEVVELTKYGADKKGRVVCQTVNNDIIRVDPERIFRLGYH